MRFSKLRFFFHDATFLPLPGALMDPRPLLLGGPASTPVPEGGGPRPGPFPACHDLRPFLTPHLRSTPRTPMPLPSPPPSGLSPGLSALPAPPPPFRAHPGWEARFPWVLQGTTLRTSAAGAGGARSVCGKPQSDHDFRIWGGPPAEEVLPRWASLRALPGVHAVVHARQPHEGEVRVHPDPGAGFLLVPEVDGHATAAPGVLLAVTVADCIPVFLAGEHAGRRGVALLHAGWRGVAAGIVERGIAVMEERFGIPPRALHLHLGPAISGARYETGPEVHEALGVKRPSGPAPLDLRDVAEERARRVGVSPGAMSRSPVCTFEDPLHFSHRGGDAGRQVAFLAIRAEWQEATRPREPRLPEPPSTAPRQKEAPEGRGAGGGE